MCVAVFLFLTSSLCLPIVLLGFTLLHQPCDEMVDVEVGLSRVTAGVLPPHKLFVCTS